MNLKIDLKQEYAPLLLICIGAILLFTFNIDFPLRFHPDEAKKMYFVRHGIQDFHHPILLLQFARIANFLFGDVELNNLTFICRMISAVSAVILVITTYYMTRDTFDGIFKWLVPLGTAASPIIVVHAHYFKEDLIFVASASASVLFYLKYLDDRSRKNLALFGVALGFALAAQYKGLILLPLFFLFPLLDKRVIHSRLYLSLLGSLAIGTLVAIAINYPALLDYSQFLKGISWEAKHATTGHDLKIFPIPHYFIFHLRNSLAPGMTVLVLSLSLLGLLYTVVFWKQSSTMMRFLVFYTLVFYLVHEITPLKPAPGYMRYMIPIVPALVIFSVQALAVFNNHALKRFSARRTTRVMAIISLIIMLSPVIGSMRLVYGLGERDTRNIAREFVEGTDEQILVGSYSLNLLPEHKNVKKLKGDLTRRKIAVAQNYGFRYVTLGSFSYERFLYALELEDQKSIVVRKGIEYREAFSKYPYIEIKPAYRPFAFSNPVIRILDISQKGENQ